MRCESAGKPHLSSMNSPARRKPMRGEQLAAGGLNRFPSTSIENFNDLVRIHVAGKTNGAIASGVRFVLFFIVLFDINTDRSLE